MAVLTFFCIDYEKIRLPVKLESVHIMKTSQACERSAKLCGKGAHTCESCI